MIFIWLFNGSSSKPSTFPSLFRRGSSFFTVSEICSFSSTVRLPTTTSSVTTGFLVTSSFSSTIGTLISSESLTGAASVLFSSTGRRST
uniref:Uncharacterized protein n=1 Tax=Bacillus subtilis TaxID=1423 RepID=P94561_BACIU|nr:hypothetical protein [Bacillus subtilis]